MSTATTVHVISSGSYSDHRVFAVVQGTREQAEALAARASQGSPYYGYDVEELLVVSPDVQQVSLLTLLIDVWDDGSAGEVRESIQTVWPFDSVYGTPDVSRRWVRAPIHHGLGGRLEVRGTDHERVRKAYSETLAVLRTDSVLRSLMEWTR